MSSLKTSCGRGSGLALAFALAASAMGQDVVTPNADQVNAVFNLTESTVISLDLDTSPATPVTVEIPIAGQTYTADLIPHSVRSPGFKLFLGQGDELVEIEPGPIRTLKGRLQGIEGSRVRGSLLEDGLYATIVVDGQSWWIQPVARYMPGADADLYVVYNNDAVISQERECGTQHAEAPRGAAFAQHVKSSQLGESSDAEKPEAPQDEEEGEAGGDGGGTIAGGINCAAVTELGIEADWYYYDDHGNNVNSVQADMEAVINALNEQYESQTGISHLVSGSIIRTSSGADPYGDATPDAFGLLNAFRSWWLNNADDIDRDVAHLFTGRNLNGSTIGIAWDIAEICTNGAYCLSQSDCCCCPSFACATDLSAHELGHLWGAFHCNCTNGTMNSFITCANNFTTGSQNSIIAHRNSRQCLDAPCDGSNDDCNNIIAITEGATSFSTENTTTDGPSESLCGFSGSTQIHNDIWYRFTAPCDGTALVRLCDALFDTRVAAYELMCPTSPNTAIDCNDDFCGDNAQIQFEVSEGSFYVVRVGGASANEEGLGNLDLVFFCAPPCPADVNGDGVVDVGDLTVIILQWGTDQENADINNDGIVDVSDLTEVIVNWGDC